MQCGDDAEGGLLNDGRESHVRRGEQGACPVAGLGPLVEIRASGPWLASHCSVAHGRFGRSWTRVLGGRSPGSGIGPAGTPDGRASNESYWASSPHSGDRRQSSLTTTCSVPISLMVALPPSAQPVARCRQAPPTAPAFGAPCHLRVRAPMNPEPVTESGQVSIFS